MAPVTPGHDAGSRAADVLAALRDVTPDALADPRLHARLAASVDELHAMLGTGSAWSVTDPPVALVRALAGVVRRSPELRTISGGHLLAALYVTPLSPGAAPDAAPDADERQRGAQ